MGKNEQLVLTSVKVHGDIFEEFKMASIKNKFNLNFIKNLNLFILIKNSV